jgi:capsular polysaccharide transport system permease protein
LGFGRVSIPSKSLTYIMLDKDNPLLIQARVIRAIVLRDMRTRFGQTFAGTAIIVLWPLSHVIVLIGAWTMGRGLLPIGTDPAIFFGTGALPYILYFYPARMIMLSIVQNRPLLGLPVVKTSDIIIARSIVDLIAAFWVVVLLMVVMLAFGIDPMPHRYADAMAAILATIYFAFAVGYLGAVMYAMVKFWLAIQIGGSILMFFASGALIVPTALPEKVRNVLWFDPLLHSVEWLRSAYYDGYGYGMLSKSYFLWSSTVILFIALAIERGARGRLMLQH